MRKRLELDQVGAVASIACAIHCAVIPIAISLSAAGVISIFDNEPVEWGFVLLAAVIGTVSAWRGYRKHGNKTVAVVLAAAALGLVLATISRHGADAHHPSHLLAWVFPLIGVTIAVAHVVNLRLCRACRGCEAHEHAPAPAR
jgi:uncharacterized membrane protein YfcA